MIGGKPVSQIQILTPSQIHASKVTEGEMEKYKSVEDRIKMIYEGAIGQSLKKHFITALRLPLHPSAGKPNEPYDKDKKSPLSNAALLFVHGGMAPVPSQAQWLAGFPKDINEVSADLLKKMQTLNPLPKKVPFKLPCMRLYMPLNFTCLT